MTVQQINYRGRKAKVGGVCFDDNGLAFFAGYSSCQGCGTRGKVLVTADEARVLAEKFGVKKKDGLGVRLTKKLSKHYGL